VRVAKRSKSVLKRIRQNEARRLRNRHYKSTLRTLIRRVREAVAEGDKEKAQAALAQAIPFIDKAASKGVIHWRNAARKVSRLTRLVNRLGESSTA